MSKLRKVNVIRKDDASWKRMFPDPEVARIKSLTREQILEMNLSEIINAAKVGNLFAGRFLEALKKRFGPE